MESCTKSSVLREVVKAEMQLLMEKNAPVSP